MLEGRGGREFAEVMVCKVPAVTLISLIIIWRSLLICTITVRPSRRSSLPHCLRRAPAPSSRFPVARTTTSAHGSFSGTSPAPPRRPRSPSGQPASVDRRRAAFDCCRPAAHRSLDARYPSTSTRVRDSSDANSCCRCRPAASPVPNVRAANLAVARPTCLQRQTRSLPYSTTNWTSRHALFTSRCYPPSRLQLGAIAGNIHKKRASLMGDRGAELQHSGKVRSHNEIIWLRCLPARSWPCASKL